MRNELRDYERRCFSIDCIVFSIVHRLVRVCKVFGSVLETITHRLAVLKLMFTHSSHYGVFLTYRFPSLNRAIAPRSANWARA